MLSRLISLLLRNGHSMSPCVPLAKAGHMATPKGMCYREGGSESLSTVALSATVTRSFITYLLSAIVLDIDL